MTLAAFAPAMFVVGVFLVGYRLGHYVGRRRDRIRRRR